MSHPRRRPASAGVAPRERGRHPRRPRLVAAALAAGATLAAAVSGFVAPVGSSGEALAATSTSSAFTKTVTISRTHLVNGVDQVADTRTVAVTVDVTKNLRDRQPVNITWTGAHPTGGIAGDPNSGVAASLEYPVVIMQCRGVDSATAPAASQVSPRTCWTQTPGERFASSNLNFPPFRLDRYAPPADRTSHVGVPDPLPKDCSSNGTDHWVPFVAEDGKSYPGGPGGCAGIAPEASEEQQAIPSNTTYAGTDINGRGSAKFLISSVDSNASLGCSSTVPCTLEIIPVMGISCDVAATGLPAVDRPSAAVQPIYTKICDGAGNYNPASNKPIVSDTEDPAVSGRIWWAASNWRNRIAVPLNFVPPSNTCDIVNTSKPVLIYGAQALRQATLQWSPEFCTNSRLFKFQHVQTSEPQAKNLVNTGTVEAAFTGAPPSEAFTKPIVQAPIAVSGFAIAFDVDDATGHALTTLKLNARLLAKLMTQSYASNPTLSGEYAGVKGNPLSLGSDPEFKALNPTPTALGIDSEPASTLFSLGSDSDVIHALTSYINADPEARAWLDGTPDPWGTKVNPNYKGIALPVDGWPLLDTWLSPGMGGQNFCLSASPTPWLNLVAAPVSDPAVVALNMQFGIANSQIICSNPGLSNQKLTGMGRQIPGRRFLIGLVSLADAARYQLAQAELQSHITAIPAGKFADASGRTFVGPTNQGIKAALALLKPVKASGTWPIPYDTLRTSAGGAAAYPGTMLMSIDVATEGLSTSDAAKLATFVRWTSTTGQTPGAANGQLPDGYLPLTAANGAASLLAYATTAADAIQAQQGYVPAVDGSSSPPSPTPTPTSTPSDSSIPTTGQPSNDTTPTTTTPSSSVTGAAPSPSPSPSVSQIQIVSAGHTIPVPPGPVGQAIPALLALAVLTGLAAVILLLWRRT